MEALKLNCDIRSFTTSVSTKFLFHKKSFLSISFKVMFLMEKQYVICIKLFKNNSTFVFLNDPTCFQQCSNQRDPQVYSQ